MRAPLKIQALLALRLNLAPRPRSLGSPSENKPTSHAREAPIANQSHPGEHLAEFLDELDISQYRLAKTIGVAPRRINEIVLGRRSVTADTALRIGKALGTTPEFWLNLQAAYDLDCARNSVSTDSIESLVAA